MTLFDYISFMEDRSNIDKYVFIKKEKTTVIYNTVEEEVTDAEGNTSVVSTQVPSEQVVSEIYKCTFLEGGGIKKELITEEQMNALISAKQAEINKIQEDLTAIQNI